MKSFFFLVFFFYTLINAYIFGKGWHVVSAHLIPRIVYSVIFWTIANLFIVAMVFRNTWPIDCLKVIYAIGTTWLACMMYFLLFFLITDIIGLLNRWLHFLPALPVSYRMVQIVLSSTVILALLVTGYFRFTHPAIDTYQLKIDKKAGERKELRVVALSDLHLGLLIDKKRLQGYIDKINALHPDVVFIAGDVVDNSTRPLNEEKMYEEFQRLNAPLGVYMCLGNHEYISGIDSSLEFLRKTGIHLLVDSVAEVDHSFYVIGRDDHSNVKRKSLKNMVAEIDSSKPVFLLDHQPFYLEDAEKNGVDFQLSGHTHNGQLWPGNLIVKSMYELGHGYKQKGKTHIYVSSGMTLWGPLFRIGTQSEITVFEITFE